MQRLVEAMNLPGTVRRQQRRERWPTDRLLITFCVALFLVSCSTAATVYEGKELPNDEISIVSTYGVDYDVVSSTINWIESVDGKNVGTMVNEVRVLPGRHSFVVHHSKNIMSVVDYRRYYRIVIDTKPGHQYRIETKSFAQSQDFFIWAIDEATEEVVAGAKPPDE